MDIIGSFPDVSTGASLGSFWSTKWKTTTMARFVCSATHVNVYTSNSHFREHDHDMKESCHHAKECDGRNDFFNNYLGMKLCLNCEMALKWISHFRS
jgi:hypothetical protein